MGCKCTNNSTEDSDIVIDKNPQTSSEIPYIGISKKLIGDTMNKTNQQNIALYANNNVNLSINSPVSLRKRVILNEIPYNFTYQILQYINDVRLNPIEFSHIITSQIEFIEDNLIYSTNKGKFIFYKEGICQIGLIKGKEAFIDIANKLCMRKPIEKLEYKEDLCMNVSNDMADWVNKHYLEVYLEEKSSYLSYEHFGFHFDLGCVDALTSVVLQVVDDNLFNCQRRNNILNEKYRYIGISYKKINNYFCLYLSFAG